MSRHCGPDIARFGCGHSRVAVQSRRNRRQCRFTPRRCVVGSGGTDRNAAPWRFVRYPRVHNADQTNNRHESVTIVIELDSRRTHTDRQPASDFGVTELYPQKRTLELSREMSALCQQRTSAPLFGSGGGIKQIEARTVTFGATDASFCAMAKPIPFVEPVTSARNPDRSIRMQ